MERQPSGYAELHPRRAATGRAAAIWKIRWIEFLSFFFLSFFVFTVSAGAFANDFGNLPQVKEITRGQPKDVVAFIERIAECNHWSGEEPFDKARAEQIRKAVAKARCGSLDSDEQAIERKYRGNKKVLNAIGSAKKLEL